MHDIPESYVIHSDPKCETLQTHTLEEWHAKGKAPKTYTLEEWHAEGERRFGPDQMAWRWICPSCGHIASPRDWEAAGAPVEAVAFSCLGRWRGGKTEKTFKRAGGPCDYAGGGLIGLNPVEVRIDGVQVQRVFDFAPEG